MNSREFNSAQKTSSSSFFVSFSAATSAASFAFSWAVGVRLRQRTYNSSMIAAGAFFSCKRLPIRLP